MLNPNVGVLDIGGVQCSGIVNPFSVLDFPFLGASTSYKISTTLLTTALSSTPTPVMGYTLVEAPLVLLLGQKPIGSYEVAGCVLVASVHHSKS